MDKKQKKNVSKKSKPVKKNTPVEQPVKSEVKTRKQTYDLPAVQCKDTLLLDYDYQKQYSKRNVVNNWDKYEELKDDDDDDDNGQLTAADFEQLLSASKSIGDHFTFASERTWLQDDDNQSDDSSLASDLFKLNISKLNNGISCLPFHMRQGLPEEMFTEEEIQNFNHRAKLTNFSDCKKNQNTLNTISNVNTVQTVTKSDDNPKKVINVATEKRKPIVETDLAKSLEKTQLSDQLTKIKSASVNNQIKPTTSSTMSKVKSNKTEDIQDWLDDILNES